MNSSLLVIVMLRPLRLHLVTFYILLAVSVSALIPFVIFVVSQLPSSQPVFADVDIQVVIIEEHHEGKSVDFNIIKWKSVPNPTDSIAEINVSSISFTIRHMAQSLGRSGVRTSPKFGRTPTFT